MIAGLWKVTNIGSQKKPKGIVFLKDAPAFYRGTQRDTRSENQPPFVRVCRGFTVAADGTLPAAAV
jgi:hypothetical protein